MNSALCIKDFVYLPQVRNHTRLVFKKGQSYRYENEPYEILVYSSDSHGGCQQAAFIFDKDDADKKVHFGNFGEYFLDIKKYRKLKLNEIYGREH
jgi:hypothetical protein